MGKNIDHLIKLKYRSKENLRNANQHEKAQREVLMNYSLETYEDHISLPWGMWGGASLQSVIVYLREKNLISDEEEKTLTKMNCSDLISDKVMAFAIVQQKYKKYKNRFKNTR